jgi:hypothetical protein
LLPAGSLPKHDPKKKFLLEKLTFVLLVNKFLSLYVNPVFYKLLTSHHYRTIT